MSMGVYLPNVDMPKGDKVLTVQICPDGSIWQQYRGTVPNAKAVPVPPHGRLIDADALMHEFEKAQRTMEQHGQEYSCSFMSSSQELSTEWYCVEDMLENAPTVIEAEEGE
jgi:hypothetical protein